DTQRPGGAGVPPGMVSRAVRTSPGVRTDAAQLALERAARSEMLGAGPVLQPLLEDPAVTDVLVNGDGSVWVDRGEGLDVRRERLPDPRRLATRLAAAAGQRLDDGAPVAEGRLPDGTRLHAVLAPLSAEGATISLRTVRRRAFALAELAEAGLTGPRGAQVLEALVALRAHVLLLQVRRANVQGAGEIDLAQLVRTAMRMRPDRLVLGECRGAEVREVLAALNTGHDGGWATVHANAAADVPARLMALGAMAG